MEKKRIRPVYNGNSLRISYSRQEEVLEIPDLIEVQKKSYEWFLKEGLKEAFADICPITNFGGDMRLDFVDFLPRMRLSTQSKSARKETLPMKHL